MTDFKNIDYLRVGSVRQIEAFNELIRLGIFDSLAKYSPHLTGTIPIGIDLPDSDLDIICECKDYEEFLSRLVELYGYYDEFVIHSKEYYGIKSTVAKFISGNFEIEIFGQNIPSEKQNAFRHMIIENKILLERGPGFREEIIKLKKSGYKTEPAFAKLLNLKGDPYDELLKF